MLAEFEKRITQILDLEQWRRGDSRSRKEMLRCLFGAAKEQLGLEICLSFTMPRGFEEAYGLSDPVTGNICVNEGLWEDCSPIAPLFYFLHELRHAVQLSHRELVTEEIRLNCRYILQFDGTGYRVSEGRIESVKMEGEQAYFTELYLASPAELDANGFAYRCLKAAGGGEELERLYKMWSPRYTCFSAAEVPGEFRRAAAQIEALLSE